jgi:uncharacterized protein YjbJ (UPF0337 family)
VTIGANPDRRTIGNLQRLPIGGSGTAIRSPALSLLDDTEGVQYGSQTMKGTADVAKGAIRDTARKVIGDKELQAEVKFDKAQGSSHNDVADMRDVGRKAREKFR